ncbi:M13 family metallopeptidase [Owenweeksia hongkongensis]|uniref:M13 family metallopeptidase n=1 Tax=Owenweeksia hongkongensis TaxID=253245 RepID=UPI003A8CEBFE
MNKKVLVAALSAVVVACQQPEVVEETPKNLGFNLADLDTTVDPCDDFYQYVAGGWMKNNPIPGTESRWGNFNILVEENNAKVRGLLDSVSAAGDLKKGEYDQLVGDFYTSAMDSAAVEAKGIEPLRPFFNLIDGFNTNEDYYLSMADLKLRGIRGPWSSGVTVDDKNSSAYIFQVSQSGLGLPDRDYYLKEDSASQFIQQEYRKHIAEMLTLSGVENAEAQADKVYNLEEAIAQIQMSRVDRRVPENVYNKMSREQIVALAPALKLDAYFDGLNVKFDSAIVAQPDYMKAIGGVLNNTSIETIKAYAKWHLVHGASEFLPHAFVQSDFNFYNKTLSGSKEMKPRWRRSLNTINSGLGEQLGHLFVDRYFPESSKAALEKMVEDLRSAYRVRIEGLEWMSDSTKEKALTKLEAFKYKIGYPNKWKDYSDLDITADNLFQNGVNLSAYGIKENLEKLGKPVDKDEWFMPAHIVNAYYSPSYNEIVFPAGILQPPFFNPEGDDAINYGAIGGVIGHEFTHGFDDRGRKYNAFGNLANWWNKLDMQRFEKRTDRMVSQYGEYQPLKEVFVNGRLTLGENIADLGGLTLAYYAYEMSHVDGKDEPAPIDGYTWEQRIFMGWGQVWSSNQTEEYLGNQVVTDPHSPAAYRVNGPMSNMPEFKAAWGCEDGDAMVRPDSVKVTIW